MSREQALHWVAEVRPTLHLTWIWDHEKWGNGGSPWSRIETPLSFLKHEDPLSLGAGRGLAAFPTSLLCFQTLKIALALASRLGDPVYDSTITESMDDMLRFVLGHDPGGCRNRGRYGRRDQVSS